MLEAATNAPGPGHKVAAVYVPECDDAPGPAPSAQLQAGPSTATQGVGSSTMACMASIFQSEGRWGGDGDGMGVGWQRDWDETKRS
jgi:hypothetical protein